MSLADARRIVGRYVEHYNTVRLHSAVGYVTPADKLAGREQAIFAQRDRRLAEARLARQRRRQGQVVAAEGSRNTQRENTCQKVEFSS